MENNSFTKLIAALGKVRQQVKALSYGDYRELVLTNRQYAFSRSAGDETVLVTVNNDEGGASLTLPAGNRSAYVGALSGVQVTANSGNITVNLPGCSGEIWLPLREGTLPEEALGNMSLREEEPVIAEAKSARAETQSVAGEAAADTEEASAGCTTPAGTVSSKDTNSRDIGKVPVTEAASGAPAEATLDEAFERGKIAGLQEAILAIMSKNGPITDQMHRDVTDNVYHDSLIAWIKSFR